METTPRDSEPVPVMSTSKPVTIAIVGAGQRGQAYAEYALAEPGLCQIVAVAEPRPKTRARMAAAHKIDRTLVFDSWDDLHRASRETMQTLGGKRLADAVIIAVHDALHCTVVQAFAAQGYHILCEKPMATSIDDCIKIHDAVKKAGIIFGMGHVLRYSPYNEEITEIVRSGALGTLVNAVHIEPVGHWHFAHSYVRGHWSQEATSSFSLMTKSCHDIDILCHWFAPEAPTRVSSFGSLQHFRKSAKPAAAGDATRCLQCPIEGECPYSAKKIYLTPVSRGDTGWPASTIVDGIPDIENIGAALATGPYGQCVYEGTNDVCDHQVVNLEFANGATAAFTMVAYTALICERQTRLHFTHGEIVGDSASFTVTSFRPPSSSSSSAASLPAAAAASPFARGGTRTVRPRADGGGHGGGDRGLARAFVEAVRTKDQRVLGTDVGDVLRAHLTVFAAERSRREGVVVDCVAFERVERERVARAEAAGKEGKAAGLSPRDAK